MKRFCTALAVILVLVSTASAQEFNEKIREALDTMRAQKKARVAVLIQLEEEPMAAFRALYDEFQEALREENELFIGLAWQYLDQDKKMTDDRALTMVREYLDMEESRARLRKSYMEQFGEILPPVQLIHLFQLENKAEAVFKHDLATHIPFLE